jgi:N-acyl-D-aspartate/D-glutamate deacylase
MHDLVIRGGTVVDGSGAPRFTADMAVRDGRVVEVGRVGARGRREIDADGLVVAPGWVDIHTHYDGQATWDPYLSPSSWHGVTSVVMGNCGVGFAPAHADQRDWMIELMEGVEDIPGAVLHEGVRWAWESFPEYLDALERMPRAVDVAAQLPHGALRVYVMGERGASREPATGDDLERMRRIARQAVAAGALGFSSSRTIVHRTSRGEAVPSLDAAASELEAIARGVGDAGAGVIQLISDFQDLPSEFELIRAVARASGRPVSFSLLQSDFFPERWRELLARTSQAHAEGLRIRAQVGCRPIGLLLGLQCSLNPFVMRAAYREIERLPLAERVRRMRDPAVRARILDEVPEPMTQRLDHITQGFDKLFPLGDPPDYEPAPESSVGARAAREGRAVEALAYDLLLEEDGRSLFYFPLYNYSHRNLDAVREMMLHPHTVLGLSDGGAHCGYICDVSFPTTLLTHWARDRARGERLSLEWLVNAQARRTAQAVGLLDRGVIAPGYRADVNLIDAERLRLGRPEFVNDLPAGGRRVVQRASGYVATIVAGETIFENGVPTGALPGALVRGQRKDPRIDA